MQLIFYFCADNYFWIFLKVFLCIPHINLVSL